jgi:hypothetical protein
MGHVIGLGSLWELKGLLAGPSRTGGTDPHFVGPLAIGAFDAKGGAGYVAGAKVPVENTGGPGTADGHWRESVFQNELMTGFLNLGRTTQRDLHASMADLSYRLSTTPIRTVRWRTMSCRGPGRYLPLRAGHPPRADPGVDASGRA